jgi:hypothetical protein
LELDHLDVELCREGGEDPELLEKRLRLHVAVQVEQAWAPPHTRGPDAARVDGVALFVLVEVAPGEARLQRLVGGLEDDVLADETGHRPATTAADRGRPHRRGEERLDREALVGGEIAERIGLGMPEAVDNAREEPGNVVGVERRKQRHGGRSAGCGSASRDPCVVETHDDPSVVHLERRSGFRVAACPSRASKAIPAGSGFEADRITGIPAGLVSAARHAVPRPARAAGRVYIRTRASAARAGTRNEASTMTRCCCLLLCLAVLATGCATSSEDEPETYEDAAKRCRDEAQRISGFRSMPKRGGTGIQRRRHDRAWEVYQREYERCMREHQQPTVE